MKQTWTFPFFISLILISPSLVSADENVTNRNTIQTISPNEKTMNLRLELAPVMISVLGGEERFGLGFDFGVTENTTLGIEMQYLNRNIMGYDIGGIGIGPRLSFCSGGKFGNGWCLSPGAGIFIYSANRSGITNYDSLSSIEYTPTSFYLGSSAGYQWFLESGLNIQLLLGGMLNTHNRVQVWNRPDGSSGSTTLNPDFTPTANLDLGYSF